MEGNTGDDCMDGGAGEDTLYGGSGRDFLHDDDPTDTDYLSGESEEDEIWSLNGAVTTGDVLDGGADSDESWHDVGLDTTTSFATSNVGTGLAGYGGTFFSYANGVGADDFWNPTTGHAGARN